MSRKSILALILILVVFSMYSFASGQALPPAIQWIPQDAIIVLEVSKPKALLDVFCNDKAITTIKELPLYKQQAVKPQFQEFLNIVSFIETTLDTNWRTALSKLTGAGITLAVCPEDTVILIIDAEDKQMDKKVMDGM